MNKPWMMGTGEMDLDGVRCRAAGVYSLSCKDSVLTEKDWANLLVLEDPVMVFYTLNGMQDNPETESIIGRLKP
jgi:hypothetical protein